MQVTRCKISGLVFSLGMIGGISTAHAESALLLKGGTYRWDDDRQSIIVTNPFSGPVVVNAVFDEDADGVFGLAYEWRFHSGFSVGPEIFHFKNDWTETGFFGTGRGDVDTYVVNVVGKKYFAPTPWLQPYLGLGVGICVADLSGAISGTGFGFSGQGVVGVEFKVGSVGIFAEAKKLVGYVEDSGDGDIDVGGTAVLGGLAIHF
jgi:hypothetical protein